MHSHLYITLQRTCVTCPTTAIFTHSGPACAIQKLRVTFMCRSHLRDSTTWYFILFYTGSGAEILGECLDRSTQQGELRSSTMSGGTDRREDEQVPQFYGRFDETFAEWETDVRLWQVEFKAVSERFARTAENHCENKAQNTRCCTVHSGQHHQMLQRQRVWRTS